MSRLGNIAQLLVSASDSNAFHMFVLADLVVKFLLFVSFLSFVTFFFPGWGRTGYNRPGASVLQEASLPVAQQDKCRAYMRYWGTVTSKMVCDRMLLYSTHLGEGVCKQR